MHHNKNSNNNLIHFEVDNKVLPMLQITLDAQNLLFGYEIEELANKMVQNSIWIDNCFVDLMSDWK